MALLIPIYLIYKFHISASVRWTWKVMEVELKEVWLTSNFTLWICWATK